MYAMYCTRPNVVFLQTFRYTSSPCTEQWQAIIRVLIYVKRTIELRSSYNSFPVLLECYTDASWITIFSDKKSTSRGGATSWLLRNIHLCFIS